MGWAADGYPVRPYRDFNWQGKLIKASITIRNSVVWRALLIFPKRFYRRLRFLAGKPYKVLMYKKIRTNWDRYWASDSDACNSIDPHDAFCGLKVTALDACPILCMLRPFLLGLVDWFLERALFDVPALSN